MRVRISNFLIDMWPNVYRSGKWYKVVEVAPRLGRSRCKGYRGAHLGLLFSILMKQRGHKGVYAAVDTGVLTNYPKLDGSCFAEIDYED